nr:hypothetical protein [Tanacetum cinerariifolium]
FAPTCWFLGAAAGTAEEQAKNFQWGLRKSTLNHLMCIPFTDVAQVANAARNYEILHERDDDDAERPDKRQKSGDRHQPTTQQSSHRNHGHNNDRYGSDRETGVNSPTDLSILVSSSPGVPLRATPTRSTLRADADTQKSVVELLADKKPGASGRVFTITEDHATKTSGFLATIHDTTSDVPSIHDQPFVSEFPDVFLNELLGIPSVRE